MSREFLHLVLCVVLVALCQGVVAGEDDDKDQPEVTSPKPSASVDQVSFVQGRVPNRGEQWPVVLIQPLVAGQPWWVQQPVASVRTNGRFQTVCNFGQEGDAGKKFAIIILLAKDKETARSYKPGDKLFELPDEAPQSEIVIVHRQ